MENILARIKIPAFTSLALVLPFIAMELINRRGYNEAFPFPLFIALWVLSVIFLLILIPLVQYLRAGKSILEKPFSFSLKFASLLLVALMWIGIVVDQLPCFMGILKCD